MWRSHKISQPAFSHLPPPSHCTPTVDILHIVAVIVLTYLDRITSFWLSSGFPRSIKSWFFSMFHKTLQDLASDWFSDMICFSISRHSPHFCSFHHFLPFRKTLTHIYPWLLHSLHYGFNSDISSSDITLAKKQYLPTHPHASQPLPFYPLCLLFILYYLLACETILSICIAYLFVFLSPPTKVKTS